MNERETAVRITVLTVPDCPNAPAVRERLQTALAGRAVPVDLVEVSGEASAARWGMAGSPTVLIDGEDPFAAAGTRPSVSCRLYRQADGTTDGAPSVADLRRALVQAGLPEAAGEECCEADILDPLGRAGRGRRAPADRGLRAVHQTVLLHFADAGTAPAPGVLDPVAAPYGRTARDVLAELAAEDFLTLDEEGWIQAAYPFSATPTPHRVRIDGGTRAWSMCAIDALGIPAMLGRDVVISSADPVTGEPVTVTTINQKSVWEPAGAVVFVGRRSGSGPAASVCCDVLNFFTSTTSARTWAGEHPDVQGEIVDQARAEGIGRQIFGTLLADD
ncbi:alkylmercury lyase [Streptomyces lunaelactis]|uniref:Alkylmercury lyase n=2 Tax=Streptomyces lunaelactis TaxID=1535768 RepID=A0A2R4T166_9ACTN|nr:alkylmercury lyase [Streptomyces lunaelactis]NUK87533.1 alkylmercury lyase [Streptomyces lunaelactis]